ncbi:Ig-like domain-containing protein [Methanoregula sp. PtaB.Bin085]|uniref:Ig-like domain-containing protein n=1 Tax=Methanoregula sp. PtaB.Bin085 TaxID=1811680 RepID=UPI0025C482FA|nr:Ig-like domain-containing protein [Methanoregula sp. PtaB.Bin085]
MRANAGFLILLGVFLLIGTVPAFVADVGVITSGKEWPVANGYDTATITVTATNMSGPAVPGAQVVFSVDNSAYGSMSPATVTTNAAGIATSTFITGTKSGTATITATIKSSDAEGSYTKVITLLQKIDHDLAQTAEFNTPDQALVGTTSDLVVTVFDSHGNLVDNLNPAEQHSFYLFMSSGQNSGFYNGVTYSYSNQTQTGAFGNTSVPYRISEKAGQNWIFMSPFGNMAYSPDCYVEGIALPEPAYITYIPHPPPSDEIPADGVAFFGLYSFVFDKYMNGINNTPMRLTASDGTSFEDTSGDEGSFYATFGPKDTASTYELETFALANTSALCLTTGEVGKCNQTLKFHNTEPVDLVLTGNPQGMASLDVDPTSTGTVLAKVVDIKGNSVIGETVSFTIGTPTYPGGPYNETSAPTISPGSAATATGGYATATFTPGAFATYLTPDDYNATATGIVTVTGTWTNKAGTRTVTKDVTFVYKNYPYLSITVPKDACDNAVVGQQINFSLSLKGDGAALRPKPIDVVLLNDRSGSMLEDNPDRMVSLMNAAILFNSKMDDSKDRVGLFSFGDTAGWSGWADLTGAAGHQYVTSWEGIDNTNSDDVAYVAAHYPASPKNYGATGSNTYSRDLALTSNPITNAALINAAINEMVPAGSTPMREGLYYSVKEIVDNKRPTAVSAVIMLTDGQYNTGGSPAGGSGTLSLPGIGTGSVINYAKANNVTLYTIGLGSSVNSGELTTFANQTGGKYYPAPSPSDLGGIYSQIAGDLQDVAGGETEVVLNYGSVKINNVTGGDITQYMQYQPIMSLPLQETDSTFIKKINVSKTGVTNIQYTQYRDDSANYTSGQMEFDVGEIRLNETWSTNFRLNLVKAGKVSLFGIGDTSSKICFRDAATGAMNCQFIEEWECPIRESKVNVPFGNNTLLVDNVNADVLGPDPNILTVSWDTTYNGNDSVQLTVSYKNLDIKGSHYVQAPGGVFFETACDHKPRSMTINTKNWPDGHYSIQVYGQAVNKDANPSMGEDQWEKSTSTAENYIQLD